jgi:hypothetical protein
VSTKPAEPADHHAERTLQRKAGGLRWTMMNPLRQRIPARQHGGKIVGQSLDDADFQG